MDAATYQAARAQVVERMLEGQPWHEAVTAAGLRISRSTAYQLLKRVRSEGEDKTNLACSARSGGATTPEHIFTKERS
jgi:hypothetical protein